MDKTVVGLYDELFQARETVQELVDADFARDRISLIANASSSDYERYFDSEGRYVTDFEAGPVRTDAGEGAGIGAIIGGLGGLLLGLGLLAVPGIGPVLAAGPILAAILGAGAGSIVGGLIGALINTGVPEETAGLYAEAVRRGASIVLITTDESLVMEAERIMNRHNPIDIEERAASWRDTGFTEYDIEGEPFDESMVLEERDRWRNRAESRNGRVETFVPEPIEPDLS